MPKFVTCYSFVIAIRFRCLRGASPFLYGFSIFIVVNIIIIVLIVAVIAFIVVIVIVKVIILIVIVVVAWDLRVLLTLFKPLWGGQPSIRTLLKLFHSSLAVLVKLCNGVHFGTRAVRAISMQFCNFYIQIKQLSIVREGILAFQWALAYSVPFQRTWRNCLKVAACQD